MGILSEAYCSLLSVLYRLLRYVKGVALVLPTTTRKRNMERSWRLPHSLIKTHHFVVSFFVNENIIVVFRLVCGLAPLTTLHGVIGYGQSCFETLAVFLFTSSFIIRFEYCNYFRPKEPFGLHWDQRRSDMIMCACIPMTFQLFTPQLAGEAHQLGCPKILDQVRIYIIYKLCLYAPQCLSTCCVGNT